MPALRRRSDMAAGDSKPVELVALGRAVRELRARRGISQETLAHRSYLHRNYVGAIERGEINPTFRILLELENGLWLPLTELIYTYERQRRALVTTAPSVPWHTRHQAAGPPSPPGETGPAQWAGAPCPPEATRPLSPHPTPSVRPVSFAAIVSRDGRRVGASGVRPTSGKQA